MNRMKSIIDSGFPSLTKDIQLHVACRSFYEFAKFVRFPTSLMSIELKDCLFMVYLHMYVQLLKLDLTFHATRLHCHFSHNFDSIGPRFEAVKDLFRFKSYEEAFVHPYIKDFGFSSEKYVIKISSDTHKHLISWLKDCNYAFLKEIIDATISFVIKSESPKRKNFQYLNLEREGKEQDKTEKVDLTSKNKDELKENSASSSTAQDKFPTKKPKLNPPSSPTSNVDSASKRMENLHIIDSEWECGVYNNASQCWDFLHHHTNSEDALDSDKLSNVVFPILADGNQCLDFLEHYSNSEDALDNDELVRKFGGGSISLEDITSSLLPDTSDKSLPAGKKSADSKPSSSNTEDQNVPKASHEPGIDDHAQWHFVTQTGSTYQSEAEKALKNIMSGFTIWANRTSSLSSDTNVPAAKKTTDSKPSSSNTKDQNLPKASTSSFPESSCPKTSVPKHNSQSNPSSSQQPIDSIFQDLDHEKRPKVAPEVCLITSKDTPGKLTCADIATDGSFVFAGFLNDIRGMDMQHRIYDQLASYKAAFTGESIDFFKKRKTTDKPIVFKGHTGIVNGVSYNIRKNLVISGSEDTTVKLWSIDDNKCIRTYNHHKKAVIDVCNSSKTDYFASASADHKAAIFNYNYSKCFMEFTGHEGEITCIRFHPNSNYLATGSADCTVKMWKTITGEVCRIIPGHRSKITCLTFSPCGYYLASADLDGMVKIFDIDSNQCLNSFVAFNNIVTSVSYNKAGTFLSVTGFGGCFKVFDLVKRGKPTSDEEEEAKYKAAVANDNFDNYHPNTPLDLVADCKCGTKNVFSSSFIKNYVLLAMADKENSQS